MGWENREYNREGSGYGSGGHPPVQVAFPRITPLALGLLIAGVVLFLVQSFTGGGSRGIGSIEQYFSLTFREQRGWLQPWRFITYQYLHGGVVHLLRPGTR